MPAAPPTTFTCPGARRRSSGVLELNRIAVLYPTVMPSYNQIGFDSPHYVVGMVEGSGDKRIGWVAAACSTRTTRPSSSGDEGALPVEVSGTDGLLDP